MQKLNRTLGGALLALLVAALAPLPAGAQLLLFEPVRMPAPGPATYVMDVEQDAHGFMWFGTQNGLFRYDGYRFTGFYNTPADVASAYVVVCLYFDRDGLLWVGTQTGLDRFDPATASFTRFQHDPDDARSLSGDHVTAITEDASGALWVGTYGGLNRFDRATGTFTRFQHDPDDASSLSDNSVTVLYVDSRGTLWVGTGTPHAPGPGGLNRFERETERFVRYLHDPEDDRSLIHNRISAILEDSRGTFWVATWGLALHTMDRDRGTFARYAWNPIEPLKSGTVPEGMDPGYAPIDVLFEDRAGGVWVSGAGLVRYEVQRGEDGTSTYVADGPVLFPESGAYSFYESTDGTVWVGTLSQLSLVKASRTPGRISRYTLQELGLDDRYGGVLSIHADPDGVVWIGTAGDGLARLDRRTGRIVHYRHSPSDPNSLSHDVVPSLHRDRQGELWVGTRGGLDRLLPDGSGFRHFPTVPGHRIYEDRAGTLWVGGVPGGLGGLARFDRTTDTFTRYVRDPSDPGSLSGNGVTAIYEDRSGTLWIGTLGGLNRFDRTTGRFTRYLHDPSDPGSLSRNTVTAIHEDRSGTLWVGTQLGGLNRFDRATGTFSHVAPDSAGSAGLRAADITSLFEARDGALWVGTREQGLHRIDERTGTYRHYSERDGLPGDGVSAILEDADGALLASTVFAVARYDASRDTFVLHEPIEDGQRQPGGAYFAAALHRGRDGELFFGRLDGFLSIDARRTNPHPPKVVFTGFSLFEQPVRPGEHRSLSEPLWETHTIKLRHDENVFSFEFAGLDYADPDRIAYAYRLEAYDEAWRTGGPDRRAPYVKVPPGTYVFRVKAANGDGVWDETGTSIRVVVLPPWWRTWWAYLLYGLLFITGVFAVNRVQRRRLLRTERERARIRAAEERAQVLQELDDLKTRFFVNVSHEFRTPLTLLLGPLHDFLDGQYGHLDPRQREPLSIMQRNGARLLSLVNQLLDLSKLEAGSMTLHARRANVVPVLRRTVAAFTSHGERKHITLQFHADEEEIDLYFEADKFEKIVTNLLSNAFKFTPEYGKIRVNVETGLGEAGAFVEIAVKDTGVGIPADELPHIFDRFHQVDASLTREQEGTGIGLALVKELVALHGGTVRVESEAGFGTTFFVRLPQGRAHLTDAEVIDETPEVLQGDGTEALDVSLEAVDALMEAEFDGASSGRPPARAPVVLIVEDNDDMRAYLRHHLADHYRIEEAEDGEAGLERARSLKPALVITDVMMPRLDGYALCRALKTDARLNHIPVILLTAKAREESKLEGLEYGADAYLYKPFSMKELLVRVENLIAIRRLLRARFSDEVVITPSEVVVSSEEAAFLARVREVVEKHMAESSFGVEALAEEVGLGRRQLQRRLQALTDLSPAGYLRMMRLERAAQLLEQQAGRVSEVAYAVGFGSAAHFSRVFREVYGVPPSAYPVKTDQDMMESDKDVTASDTRKSSRR